MPKSRRYIITDAVFSCEFAIVAADAWRHRGVGTHLMHARMDAARQRGLHTMFGEVFRSNHKMPSFVGRLGFHATPGPGDTRVMRIEAKLQDRPETKPARCGKLSHHAHFPPPLSS